MHHIHLYFNAKYREISISSEHIVAFGATMDECEICNRYILYMPLSIFLYKPLARFSDTLLPEQMPRL
jgi:hypothetical protein